MECQTLQSGTQYYSSISDFPELRNGTYDIYIGNDSGSSQPVGAIHRFRLFAKQMTLTNSEFNNLLS